jgi:hypothetical protein
MPRRRKPTPLAAFEDNIADAERLVAYARALTNRRLYRFRKELRAKLATALRVPDRDQDAIDGLESDGLFVVFKPGAQLSRADFADSAPLLRQAIVAGCAATETFLSDRTVGRVRDIIKSRKALPPRLSGIPMTVEQWHSVDAKTYRRRAITDKVIEPFVREYASTAPNKFGELLSMIGVSNWSKQVDALRKVPNGTTVEELQHITDRRNKIAHESDRRGDGRASISVDEVERILGQLRSIVESIDMLLK